MSLFAQTAIGIDVWDGTLKAVRLSRRGRRVTLERTWRTHYAKSADPRAAALDALGQLVRGARFGGRARVVISAPTQGMFSSTYLIPTMAGPRLDEMVEYELLSELDALPEDLLIRHHVRKGVVEQQVHAYALRRRDVDDLRRELHERRVPYDDLETPGYALASLVEHELPSGRDRVLLAVGRLATELVLLTEHGVWMRHLPLGSHHERDATRLAQRLAREIDAAATYFLPTDRRFKPLHIVLTEEGALDAQLTGALKQATGLDVVRMSSLQRIRTPGRLDWDDQKPEQALAMGKALGLALCGLDMGRFRSPAVTGNARRDVRRLVPAVAAAVLLAGAGLVTTSELAVARAERLGQTLPAELADDMRTVDSERRQTLDATAVLEAQSAALQSLAERRTAAFMPRRALTRVGKLATGVPASSVYVTQVWLSPGSIGHTGVMTVTLHAAKREDESLADRLLRAFTAEFGDVAVRGPESAGPDSSRYVIEVTLP